MPIPAVFMDHNATTPMKGEVMEAMLPWFTQASNASSVHRFGHRAREAVERARRQVADLVGASADEVIFTSGGTEANNLALRTLVASRPGTVVTSAVEHPAVAEPARALGRAIVEIPPGREGSIEAADVAEVLRSDAAVASVIWANNETGIINDIHGIAEACQARGVPLHSDAVQAAGKIPVAFRSTGLAALSISAHKIHGPQGIGALVIDRALPFTAMVVGGGQQGGLRGGTEPVALIVGFGVAAELAASSLAQRAQHCEALRKQLEQGLGALSGVTILGTRARRLPNTVQFAVDGIDGEALVLALDEAGFAVSSGSACASGRREPSRVALALGLTDAQARSLVRVSVGEGNTAADIDGFLRALVSLLAPGSLLAGGGAMGGW